MREVLNTDISDENLDIKINKKVISALKENKKVVENFNEVTLILRMIAFGDHEKAKELIKIFSHFLTKTEFEFLENSFNDFRLR